MSRPNPDQPAWTEAQVDAELRDFFRREVPAALPAAVESPDRTSRAAVPRPTTAARYAAAASVALVLVVAALSVVRPSGDRAAVTHGPADAEQPSSLDGERRPVESPRALYPVQQIAPDADDLQEWEIEVFPIDDPPPGESSGPVVAEPAPTR